METLFSKMASQIEDIPMARLDNVKNNDPGWEFFAPNRFKLDNIVFLSYTDFNFLFN